MQEVIVYILIGMAVLVVAIRIYRIFTKKHNCCGEGEDNSCCEGCELAKECSKMNCKHQNMHGKDRIMS